MRLEYPELHTPIHQLSLVGLILYEHIDKKKHKHVINVFWEAVSSQNNCEKESGIWVVSLWIWWQQCRQVRNELITCGWPVRNGLNDEQLSKFAVVTFYQVFYFNPIKPICQFFLRLDSRCYHHQNNKLSVLMYCWRHTSIVFKGMKINILGMWPKVYQTAFSI